VATKCTQTVANLQHRIKRLNLIHKFTLPSTSRGAIEEVCSSIVKAKMQTLHCPVRWHCTTHKVGGSWPQTNPQAPLKVNFCNGASGYWYLIGDGWLAVQLSGNVLVSVVSSAWMGGRLWYTISLCNQPPRSTHHGYPSVGRHNEYQLRLGR